MVPVLKSSIAGPDGLIFDALEPARSDILALDHLAGAAWPAPVQEDLQGWTLRFANGVSRRANSVAPLAMEQYFDLLQAIDTVEAFYRERGLPPRFQMSPAAEPRGLDNVLTKRGYQIETPVSIQIARVADVAGVATNTPNARLSTTPPDGWWEYYKLGFSRDVEAIVSNAHEQPLYASAHDEDGAYLGIGLGVAHGNWLGVFAMWIHPHHRRRGIGRQIISDLAKWMVDRDGLGVYLQVEDSNKNAKQVYERIGFRTAYGYHYRTLWNET